MLYVEPKYIEPNYIEGDNPQKHTSTLSLYYGKEKSIKTSLSTNLTLNYSIAQPPTPPPIKLTAQPEELTRLKTKRYILLDY